MAIIFYFAVLILISIEQLVHLERRGQAVAISMYANSEDEDAALTEFRELVAPLAYRTFMKSDGYLIRWLMQYDFDVDEAFENFKKTLEWRRRKRVDQAVCEEMPLLDEELSYSLDTLDKDGRPVVVTPLGRHDLRKVIIAGGDTSYFRYLIRMYEICEIYLHHIRTTTNPNVTQAISIQDLAGFNVKTVGCFKCINMIPEVIADIDPNYPRLFHKGFIINMPIIFQTALGMILKFLSEKSRETLQAFGHDKNDWMPVLHEQIALDQLPLEYGGTMPALRGKAAKDSQLKNIKILLTRAQEAAAQDFQNRSDVDVSASESALIAPDSLEENTSNIELHLPSPSHPHRHHEHHHHHYHATTTPRSGSLTSGPGVFGHGNETKSELKETVARAEAAKFWDSTILLHPCCLHSLITVIMHFMAYCLISNE